MADKITVEQYFENNPSPFEVCAADLVIQKMPEGGRTSDPWTGWIFDFRNNVASYYSTSYRAASKHFDGSSARITDMPHFVTRTLFFHELPAEIQPLKEKAEQWWMQKHNLDASIK